MWLEKEDIELFLIQIVRSLTSMAWASLSSSDLNEQFAMWH